MKKVVFLLLVIFPSISFSQKETAIWYFGQYAGLDFNSGAPVVITDGQLNTYEGCATISDSQGNLLFYTDGVTVWDKNHNIMPNGTGLRGNASSTQSAIIVPKPNNLNQYYIFTVDERNSFSALSTDGIRYTTVDLSLNGGTGDVVASEKNLVLVSRAYEKITAVKHADNNSFWVISFIQDQFLAWRIDATGVNTTPVVSNVTMADDSRGYLKISTDSKKIACANFGNTHSMMIYDFDNATGIVSNEIQLTLDEADDIPYGVEFSTQNKKLYVTTSKLSGNTHIPPSKLLQFDLLSPNISNSRVLLHTSTVNTRGALQLALDGKIYRALSISGNVQAGTPYLGVINNPEADGAACNYVHDAIDVSNGDPNRKAVEGLPPFMQSYFLTSISANDVCFGDATQFTLNSTVTPDSITWDFGDPSTGTNNTSTLINPTHIFSSSGVFTITATVVVGIQTSVLTIDVTIYDLPVINSPITLTQCDDDIDGIANFNLEEANAQLSSEVPAPTITYFLTENEAINNTNPITNTTAFSNSTSSTVWARVENTLGCFDTAQVNLEVISTNIPSDLMLIFNECDDLIDNDDTNGITTFDFSSATNQILEALLPEQNLIVTYYQNTADALAEQNSITPNNYRNTSSPYSQDIIVRVDDADNGCFGLGHHITLNVNKVPSFDLATSTTLCLNALNATISIENPADTYQYVWRDDAGNLISDFEQAQVTSEGIYTVTATDTNGNYCEKTKSIEVFASPVTPLLNFDINNIQIIDNSTQNTITVLTNTLPNSTYEFAIDDEPFQTNNVFEDVSPGIHIIRIRDIENCSEASVEVGVIYIPNFFTPNEDGYNDTWHVIGVDFYPNASIYIFDRFGKLIAILDPLGPGWNGMYKGNPLPSTDYWYKVELEGSRVLKGHFSLIR